MTHGPAAVAFLAACRTNPSSECPGKNEPQLPGIRPPEVIEARSSSHIIGNPCARVGINSRLNSNHPESGRAPRIHGCFFLEASTTGFGAAGFALVVLGRTALVRLGRVASRPMSSGERIGEARAAIPGIEPERPHRGRHHPRTAGHRRPDRPIHPADDPDRSPAATTGSPHPRHRLRRHRVRRALRGPRARDRSRRWTRHPAPGSS